MKKFNVKAALIPAISLFAICLIVTALLVGTNIMTDPKIEILNKEKAESSRKVVLSKALTFKEVAGQENTFEGLDESGSTVGFVFTTETKGYGGTIVVMTGISSENKETPKVEGVVLLSQNETPGLGANATKEEFRDQFKQDMPDAGFSVTKSTANDGEIEAMTGATISSKAVTDAVNLAIDKFNKMEKTGGVG